MLFKKHKIQKVPETKIHTNEHGVEVLRKTEDFTLYVIRKFDDDSILGTVLLTATQAEILNRSCNEYGIKFAGR